MEHFVDDHRIVRGWFAELSKNKEEKLAYIYNDNLGGRRKEKLC